MVTSAKRIALVVGARPNFMKVAPLIHQFRIYPDTLSTKLIHTGQHYDNEMSNIFFEDLDLPEPDYFLGVGSGTHAEQTAGVMIAFERVCLADRPDLVIVVGDVNSTLACALTAKKLAIAVAHVEAGLRSRDWSMPEEINRIVTDAISDLLFTPSRDADQNLLREGISPQKIHFVGNVMIDALFVSLPKAQRRDTLARFGVESQKFATCTLHRPSNVDDPNALSAIIDALIELSHELRIVWPLHPRTKKNMQRFGLLKKLSKAAKVNLLDPLGYLDMLALNQKAKIIITDSGGLQEEATVLGVPCITLRENTERPVTVDCGCNQVVGNKPPAIRAALISALNDKRQNIRIPELWDGQSSQRIIEVIARQCA